MDTREILSHFPQAAPWSLWTGQLGRGFIIAGLVFFGLAILGVFLEKRAPVWRRVSSIGFVLGGVSLFGAMACLMALFANNQFQYQTVFAHSDVHSELKYRFASVWAGQEGSFLLWACTMAVFGLLSFRGTGEYRRWYVVIYALILATLCGILIYETPFDIIPDVFLDGRVMVPPTGSGLNPSLQNYWFTIHPPTIFMGFGALTVPFCYAVAAILTGNLKDWVNYVRPWVMIGLSLVGVGLIMGGLWAYETLSFGGFWKWDPVEDASFVPWLMMAAFVHGILVQTTKKRWHGANLWLGALPFLTFAYGTFLTRSGFLTDVSVHSFVEMNKSALVILEIFVAAAFLFFLGLYFWRGHRLARSLNVPNPDAGFTRETSYLFGTLLLTMLAFVVAIGMSWPFIMTKILLKKAAVIDEWLYHDVVVWFFVPIMVLMAIAPFLSWRSLPAKQFISRFINVFSLSAGLAGFAMFGINNPNWGVPLPADPWVNTPFGHIPITYWMAFMVFLCMFVAVSSVWRIAELAKRAKMSLGGFIAHLGVATVMAGLILSRGMESHAKGFVRGIPDDKVALLGYNIAFGKFTADIRNRDNKVEFTITPPSGPAFKAYPGLYYFRGTQPDESAMVWPHIERFWSHDLYFVLHEPIIDAWKDPAWFKPGETKTIDDIQVTYLGMDMQGEPGQSGTSFGAKLKIAVNGQTYDVDPKMVIGGEPDMPEVGSDLRVAMLQMNAADRSALIQIYLSTPVYPVELYYKPMTALIWLGTGILLCGGLLTAFARRRPKSGISSESAASAPTET